MKRLLRSSILVGALVGLASSVPPAYAAGPVISAVTPVNTTVGVPTTLSATVVVPTAGIQSCNLYVDLADVGPMGISGNVASVSYTFTGGGSRIAFVFCRDTDGKANAGPTTSIWVDGVKSDVPAFTGSNQSDTNSLGQQILTPAPAAAPQATSTPSVATGTQAQVQALTPPVSPSSSGSGQLIKLPCVDGAPVEDPCHAVYFGGVDGKRHAFPNAKIFFTWYADFSSVIEVDPGTMSSIPLGKNVPYRPGSRMVKFPSVNNVYAVAKGGVLRWVTSEDAAKATYGDAWNTKIDDIDEAFYNDYTFGADIKAKNDYDPTVELGLTTSIDQGL